VKGTTNSRPPMSPSPGWRLSRAASACRTSPGCSRRGVVTSGRPAVAPAPAFTSRRGRWREAAGSDFPDLGSLTLLIETTESLGAVDVATDLAL
jgi:hypothetical protein